MKGKKVGGRVQGSVNIITAEVRQRLKLIFDNEIEYLEANLKSLIPKDRINFLVSILPYMISKMPTETIITETQPLRFQFDTVDICERIEGEVVVTSSIKMND